MSETTRRWIEAVNLPSTKGGVDIGQMRQASKGATAARIRVEVVLATGSVLRVVETVAANQEVVWALNGGLPLVAGAWYEFRFALIASATYAFQVATETAITRLIVEEVLGRVVPP